MAELARLLRTWRDRVTPESVGLPAAPDRRTPGLRREELAALAGLSVDYVVRLEQGRATHPSPQVLGALARALRLGDDERDHLFRMAGIEPPAAGTVPRHIPPGVQRIVDRLSESPAAVYSAAWDMLYATPLWSTLFDELAPRRGRDANVVWNHFTRGHERVLFDDEHEESFSADLVSDLHTAADRYPRDAELARLVRDLRAASADFERRWGSSGVTSHKESRKTVLSEQVGPIALDCDVLTAPGHDLRIVVYTATPGTPDADALDLLRVTGTQVLSSLD